MIAKEISKTWKAVVSIYKETRDYTPKTTVDAIIGKFGINVTKEVFATVAEIKKHDGRICEKNREYLRSVSVDPRNVDRDSPVMYAGLDDIHTSHIDQMITELRGIDRD